MGGGSPDGNVFKVKNINDNKHLVQQGLMEVTSTELVYIDSSTREEWHWPLKYLRKYGCDGDVFTFEAGRKCAGGEGLYAFSTKKASIVFELVARNINQGEIQSAAEAPTTSEPQAPDTSTLSFPQKRTISSPTRNDQPSYLNLDLKGNPLPNGGLSSSSNPDIVTADTDKAKSFYREVVFEKPADEHPKPLSTTSRVTSYSKIDFEQTAKYNRELQVSVLPISGYCGQTSFSSTSIAGRNQHHQKHHHNSGGHNIGGGRGRSRNHTYSGNDREHKVSKSESSFSSQSSLTESSRDVRNPCKANGGVTTGVSTSPDLNLSMYQNVKVGGGSLPEPQLQYQNVNIGTGSVNQVFENNSNGTITTAQQQQLPNYCNINITAAAAKQNGGETSSDLNTSSSSIRQNGHSMRSHAYSVSGSSIPQSSYLQLNFSKEKDTSSLATTSTSESEQSQLLGRRSASVGGIGAISPEPSSAISPSIINQHIPEEDVALPLSSRHHSESSRVPVVDTTRVSYEVLNFPTMLALSELSTQREQEIEKEREQREKDKATAAAHKKKK